MKIQVGPFTIVRDFLDLVSGQNDKELANYGPSVHSILVLDGHSEKK